MSLFGQLQRLYRSDRFQLEDFHTEIVAQMLRDSPALTLGWLRYLQVIDAQHFNGCTIETQKTFAALPGHEVDSRPDMVIHITGVSWTGVVFIESKIGSHAAPGQLERYLEHLKRLRIEVDQAGLVFVTRDFEADYADDFAHLGHHPNGVFFRQTRWFEFYRQLRTITKENPLARQLTLFMQEHRMNLHPRFRTIDIAALENFLPAKALMDETLQGKVRQTMLEKLQDASALSKAMSQLSGFSRYILYAVAWPKADYECLVGYWIPDESWDEEVWVGIMLQFSPKAAARKAYATAFGEWSARGNGWEVDNLTNDQDWGSLYKGRELSTFLAQPDHVEAIRSYLLELLDEVAEFRTAHLNLPWREELSVPETSAAGEADEQPL